MARRFNTTGPCIPAEHYMLSPEKQCPGALDLIEQKHYFIIYAPRQSGKTTLLQYLEKRGLEQITRYLDSLGCREGWLVLFNTLKGMSWRERIKWKNFKRGERTIHMVSV